MSTADLEDDFSILIQALRNMKLGAAKLAASETEYAERAMFVSERCEAMIRSFLARQHLIGPETDVDPPIGMMEAPDQFQEKRQFCTATLGAGRVAVAWGTWGKLGMLQILPAITSMEAGGDVSKENIAPGPGMMLLFKDRAAVERLAGMLRRITEPKEEA